MAKDETVSDVADPERNLAADIDALRIRLDRLEEALNEPRAFEPDAHMGERIAEIERRVGLPTPVPVVPNPDEPNGDA